MHIHLEYDPNTTGRDNRIKLIIILSKNKQTVSTGNERQYYVIYRNPVPVPERKRIKRDNIFFLNICKKKKYIYIYINIDNCTQYQTSIILKY